MTNKIITLHDAHDGHEIDVFVDHIFHMEDRVIANPKYDVNATVTASKSKKKPKAKEVEPETNTITVLYSHDIANAGNSIYVSESRDVIKKLVRAK